MQRDLIPGWVRSVASYNPVEWTIQAGRDALTASPDWGLVLSRAGLLAALCATCTWLATRAFRSYQRSIQAPCVRGSSGGGAATPAGVGGGAPGGR